MCLYAQAMPRIAIERSQVIDAAMSLTDEDGPDAPTYAAIATRLGVSTGAIQHHCGDVASLRAAIATRSLAALHECLVDAVIGMSGADAIDALCVAWREWASDHPNLYLIATSSTVGDDEDVAEATRQVMLLLARIIERSGRTPESAVHTARFVRSAIHGFVSLEIGGGFVLSVETEASFDELCSLLVQAAS